MTMEILSPVGSPEGLSAPMDGGCDAVYLAGKSFGARAMAKNFTDKQLEGAVGYAHDRGVKVYVTVNTLVRNNEMEEAVSLVRFLADIGADGVLVQDFGLLKNLSSIDIPKHASTQMQIHSLEGLKWCSENGLDRAVLARELTMEELERIVPESPIETEVFVHGGLCHCMSGGCLMSAFIGGRSGNRGMCAQPCRKYYEGNVNKGFMLSSADIYGIDHIARFKELGVDSLKIEGRMKSPTYAYLTAKAYRMARDGITGPEYDETLEMMDIVFNRGSAPAYLDGVKTIVQPLYPDNRGVYLCDATVKNNTIVSEVPDIHPGDGLSLYSGFDKIGGFRVKDTEHLLLPFKLPNGDYELRKTDDARFEDIRRSFSEVPKLTGDTQRRPVTLKLPKQPVRHYKPELSFYVSTLKTLKAALPYADRIYFDDPAKIEQAKDLCGDVELVNLLPRFDALDEEAVTDMPVMVNNAGQYRACRKAPRIYASNIMNVFNSYFPMDVYQTTISTELARNEVSDLISYYPGRCEVMAFGRMELMYSRDPGSDDTVLKDEREASFPVYRDSRGFTRVLNSVDLYLLDSIEELGNSGAVSLGLDLRKRPPELAKAVGEMCRNPDQKNKDRIFAMCGGTVTRGLYQRGV
jgi:putative protease